MPIYTVQQDPHNKPGDMATIDRRLLASIADCNRKFVAKSTRADITELKDRMKQLLAVYSQQQRNDTGQDCMTLCDQLHQEWYG